MTTVRVLPSDFDNWSLSIVAHTPEALKSALQLCLMHTPGNRVDGYSKSFGEGIDYVNFYHDLGTGITPFLASISNSNILSDLIMAWLDEVKYPKEPCLDGTMVKGFRVQAGDAYVKSGENYIAFSIEPWWCLYHK